MVDFESHFEYVGNEGVKRKLPINVDELIDTLVELKIINLQILEVPKNPTSLSGILDDHDFSPFLLSHSIWNLYKTNIAMKNILNELNDLNNKMVIIVRYIHGISDSIFNSGFKPESEIAKNLKTTSFNNNNYQNNIFKSLVITFNKIKKTNLLSKNIDIIFRKLIANSNYIVPQLQGDYSLYINYDIITDPTLKTSEHFVATKEISNSINNTFTEYTPGSGHLYHSDHYVPQGFDPAILNIGATASSKTSHEAYDNSNGYEVRSLSVKRDKVKSNIKELMNWILDPPIYDQIKNIGRINKLNAGDTKLNRGIAITVSDEIVLHRSNNINKPKDIPEINHLTFHDKDKQEFHYVININSKPSRYVIYDRESHSFKSDRSKGKVDEIEKELELDYINDIYNILLDTKQSYEHFITAEAGAGEEGAGEEGAGEEDAGAGAGEAGSISDSGSAGSAPPQLTLEVR